MTLPSPKATFRPRADSSLLSRLVREAWDEYLKTMLQESETKAVAEIIAAHIEGLVPPADMAVLKRYGFAHEIVSVTIHMFNGRDWSMTTGVTLPRKMWGRGRDKSFHCGGPRHSEDPTGGLKPEYRARLTDAEFEDIMRHHREREHDRLPRSVEPYFAKIVEVRNAYNAEYGRSTEYPGKFKAVHRRYPAWAEIERELPVLGAHIAKLRGELSLDVAA